MAVAKAKTPPIDPTVTKVIEEVNKAVDSEFVQVTASRVTPKIPAKARNVLYTLGVIFGAIGTAAPLLVAALTGNAAVAAASVGALALALQSWLAKLNLSRTADDIEAAG